MKYLEALMDSRSKKYNLLFIAMIILFAACDHETKMIEKKYISMDKSFSLDGSNHVKTKINKKNPDNLSLETHITPLSKDSSLNISWQILNSDFPASWEYSLCDNTGCFFELPQKNQLDIIPKTINKKEFSLKLQINTFGIEGSSSLILLLKNKEQTSTDTLFFEANF